MGQNLAPISPVSEWGLFEGNPDLVYVPAHLFFLSVQTPQA